MQYGVDLDIIIVPNCAQLHPCMYWVVYISCLCFYKCRSPSLPPLVIQITSKCLSRQQLKETEKRDAVLTPKQQIDRLLRPGASYANLNPFEVLQVDPTTPIEEIKKKFRRVILTIWRSLLLLTPIDRYSVCTCHGNLLLPPKYIYM